MELKAVVITIVGMVLLATPTLSLPDGAPDSVCSSMTPGHGSEQTAASPYSISVNATKFKAGYTFTVTVSGPVFMGILMQVRKAGDNTGYGKWSSPADNTKLKMCTSADDSITHANTNAKQNAVFTWTAPEGVTDDLEVIATVAQERFVWWKGVKSNPLIYDSSTSTCIGSALTVFLAIFVALLAPRFH